MRELNVNEIEQVNGGGIWFAAGYAGAAISVGATTFRAAYETATFFGAGRLGRAIGGSWYGLLNN